MSLSNTLLHKIPKVELHLHIEGTLEPELMFELARRNHIRLPYQNVDEVREAYQFEDLSSFLKLYYQGADTLKVERDFYDLTFAYLSKAKQQNMHHVEIFFDPQAHTTRGIAFDTVFNGIKAALQDGQREFAISYEIIACFLRDMPETSAFATLE